MYIAIDDTYSSTIPQNSKYITDQRRTHVAVVFTDIEVNHIRKQINDLLQEVSNDIGKVVEEFHFVDIYNQNGVWGGLSDEYNLDIIECFATIYKQYKWPVHIQSIDEHTFKEHGIVEIQGKLDGLDLSTKEGQSLLFLLHKIKRTYISNPSPLKIYMDEGKQKPGSVFAKNIFHDWPCEYDGVYASSVNEPLLQIADFLAYSINRVKNLSLKAERSDIDLWFMELIADMGINNTEEISRTIVPENFMIEDIDKIHEKYRRKKGL